MWRGQGERVSAPQEASDPPLRRGDRQRNAIVAAVRELLTEKPFAELSVSTISDRAGARSGFYFYFDSKYAVLAHILGEVAEELEELTQDFAPRGPGETPPNCQADGRQRGGGLRAQRPGDVGVQYRPRHRRRDPRDPRPLHNEAVIDQIVPIVEAEIAGGNADPITADVRGLVRTLRVTAMTLSGETMFTGPDRDLARAVDVLEKLWCTPCGAAISAISHGLQLCRQTGAGDRRGQRHRARRRAAADSARAPSCT